MRPSTLPELLPDFAKELQRDLPDTVSEDALITLNIWDDRDGILLDLDCVCRVRECLTNTCSTLLCFSAIEITRPDGSTHLGWTPDSAEIT